MRRTFFMFVFKLIVQTNILYLCNGLGDVVIFKAYQPFYGIPVQSWVEKSCEYDGPICCSVLCKFELAHNKGCLGFQALSSQSCRMFVMTDATTVPTNILLDGKLFIVQDVQMGSAILMVGGFTSIAQSDVFIFTTDGQKMKSLKSLPAAMYDVVLAIVLNTVWVCSGRDTTVNRNCWQYNFDLNTWSLVATSTYAHSRKPGIMYQSKLYIVDDTNAEYFDPATGSWLAWPNAPSPLGDGSCVVIWKHYLVLAGGVSGNNWQSVILFDFELNSWGKPFNSGQYFLWLSCSLVPNQEGLLLVASEYIVSLFDLVNLVWKSVAQPNYRHDGGNMVVINGKVLLMGGYDQNSNIVDSFDFPTNTWVLTKAKMPYIKRHTRSLAIPTYMLGSNFWQ